MAGPQSRQPEGRTATSGEALFPVRSTGEVNPMAIDPEMIRVVEGVLHTYQNLPSEELAERVINAVHAWDECQEASRRPRCGTCSAPTTLGRSKCPKTTSALR